MNLYITICVQLAVELHANSPKTQHADIVTIETRPSVNEILFTFGRCCKI